ncbi:MULTISPECIES: hypothetical protein [unclassified Streptomyces]|uniref:hypothetical protein n=1 Tax=unclassified Streptomyces TaxID=2593676 RepID=UPI0006AE96A3|nr:MULTISPECIES: hypothetical protein [unclassified Streptomyces]KOU81008.1 hypothetical protein ADK93_32075 [Streptomyces sp. XY58]KOV06615.1 hypothetical protein ADK89_14040 [Streptomyces sp. XY37]KOV41881.1 hypothetical protein ADK99_31225 [Streptomyces sp. MMG1064]
MRAFRAVAAVLLSAVVLAGCGPSGSGGADDARPGGSAEPATSTGTSTGADPAASPSTGPSAVPAPGDTLVRVTRSGGFAGETHTLVVKGDGSWSRLDGKAQPEGTGKLSEQELAALRTALREADFARLPRIATGGPKIYDGFFYAFAHGGYEVAGEQGSLPPALERVAQALPPFTAR